ncbi:MAG TPA: VWA domain-containing protein [Candidatus Sulfotelmatobacter sp.]
MKSAGRTGWRVPSCGVLSWSAAGVLACLLAFVCAGLAQDPGPPRTSTPPPNPTASPTTPSGAASSEAAPADAAPGDSAPADAAPAQNTQGDGFVFRKQVEEIILHATVIDPENRPVTGLSRESFQVFEDGKPQRVTSFRKERVPIALGILIDNSGSMLPKRAQVNQAALQLVDASQDQDQVFVVNFGDDAFLDQDYTQDVGKLRLALQRVETKGSTALYDAIIGAADHLNQTSPLQKKVLLVVTDGRDNASQATFQQVLRKLQQKNGPVLYMIALEQNEWRNDRDRQSLITLSAQTGGAAFFPASVDEIQSIASSIARDIRSQYVIGYHSSNPHTAGVYHSIEVHATEGSTPLRVATRTGYYSGNSGNSSPK